jgi:drug/metabolite transporter (DMT)-like permease
MLKNIDKGILYMLFASFLFACMGMFAKILSQNLSSIEIVFFRNVSGIFILSYSIYKTPIVQEGGKPLLLFFRGLIGFCALAMFFYNITTISLAEAMTFSKTSPIFTAIFAFIFLKEALSRKAWIGIFIGFIGILFITKFTGENLSKADWLGILSGVGAALAYTSIRELKRFYDVRVIVLSFVIVGTLFPLVFMLVAQFYTNEQFDFLISPFVMPSGIEWLYIVLLGIFSTFAQLFMTKAYSVTKAGIIGAIGYSTIVFSIVIGMLLGDLFPDIYTSIGIVLIITSGILVSKNKK